MVYLTSAVLERDLCGRVCVCVCASMCDWVYVYVYVNVVCASVPIFTYVCKCVLR